MLHVNGPSSTAALINAFIDSDDEPLYDKVASDEDYSSLPNNGQQKRSKINKKTKKVNIEMKEKRKKFFFRIFSHRYLILQKNILLMVYYNLQLKYIIFNLFFLFNDLISFILEFKFIGNFK